MKVIAIVELPDDAFDDEAWGDGKWMIDDEGAIRYKEDNALVHYKDIDVDGIELRPLPKHITDYQVRVSFDYDGDYALGWNECLNEILGESDESNISD